MLGIKRLFLRTLFVTAFVIAYLGLWIADIFDKVSWPRKEDDY